MSTPVNPLRSAADEAILSWPNVRAKQVFGHRGYVHSGKMFAFFADGGAAFKAADAAAAEGLYAEGSAKPFLYHGSKEMHAWPVLPLTNDPQLAEALSAIRSAYERTC